MLYIGGRYSAVLASDRGLILDMYGVNSFGEDIEKKMSQLTANSTQVCWPILLICFVGQYFYYKTIPLMVTLFYVAMKTCSTWVQIYATWVNTC